MEDQLRSSFEKALSVSPNIEALASARSLLINPSTSPSTISSLFQSLSPFLHLHHPHPRHVLNLLSDLSRRAHTHLTPLVFSLVRDSSLLDSESPRLAAQSLSLLAVVADHDTSLAPAMEEIGEAVFLSLTYRASPASVRRWLLLNAVRFFVGPSVLLTVLLGFTKDPYPYVRRVALDGLVGLCKTVAFEDRVLIEGCYCRAVELLRDMEDCVRSSAVRAVRWRFF